jgi:hypothetical protein
MKFLSIVLIGFLIQAATQAQPQTATIHGIVVDRRDGQPLPNTAVELQLDGGSQFVRRTTTGDDGQFVFAKTAAGSYRVLARRSGFVPSQYGQKGINDPGLLLAIDTADANNGAKDIRIVMSATGSITGRITGDDGLPVGSVNVQALKASYQDGHRVLTSVQEVLTDDLGVYRLFWLTPGTYYVGATIPDGPIDTHILLNPEGVDARGLYEARTQLRPVATTSTRNSAIGNRAHIPVYYPGTGSGTLAKAILVESGADIRGIDIKAATVNTYRVTGVFTRAGQPVGANVTVRLLPVATNPAPQYQAVADATTGTFEFPKVVPGSFVLTGAVAGPNGARAQTSVEVVDRDIENIPVMATAGVPLQIRLRAEGQVGKDGPRGEVDLTKLRVSLRPDPFVSGLPSPAATPAADGTATFQGVLAGDYRVYVMPLLNPPGAGTPAVPNGVQNLYLKSARRGSDDVLNRGLSLKEEPGNPVVDIVLGSNPARITGHVTRTNNNRQELADRTTVVLIPDQGRGFRTDIYKIAVTDTGGKFQMLGIPPGNYRLFAWDDVSGNAWMDPEFLRIYENRGSAVVISEGSEQDITLDAIR